MLKTRIITALVLLAIFLPVLFLAPVDVLRFVLSFVIGLAAWEWARLLTGKKVVSIVYAFLITAILYGIWFVQPGSYLYVWVVGFELISLPLALLVWLVIVPLLMKRGVELKFKTWKKPLLVIGFVLFPASWVSLEVMRDLGLWTFLSVLVWVWAADVGAYFAGKAFGKRKLAPNLSPGKTVEGLVGGLVLVVVVSIACVWLAQYQENYFSWLQEHIGWFGMLLVAIAGSLLSVIGDLFESQLKRLAGVKDSSQLLPGHGGFLDRLDALLPVLPFAAVVALFVAG